MKHIPSFNLETNDYLKKLSYRAGTFLFYVPKLNASSDLQRQAAEWTSRWFKLQIDKEPSLKITFQEITTTDDFTAAKIFIPCRNYGKNAPGLRIPSKLAWELVKEFDLVGKRYGKNSSERSYFHCVMETSPIRKISFTLKDSEEIEERFKRRHRIYDGPKIEKVDNTVPYIKKKINTTFHETEVQDDFGVRHRAYVLNWPSDKATPPKSFKLDDRAICGAAYNKSQKVSNSIVVECEKCIKPMDIYVRS